MPSLPKLYAILDTDALATRGLDPRVVLDIWLDAGIRLIQLRAKTMASGALLTLAEALVERARSAGATFIVNDRADIALMAGADGVHVGQEDLTPTAIRSMSARSPGPEGPGLHLKTAWRSGPSGPDEPLVGLSTHTLAQLRAGLDGPSDYLAIGPVFATSTKATADPVVGLEMVGRAAAIAAGRPLVAIGGITLATAPAVLAAGAASVAVISDLLLGDLRARAREFVAICQ